MIIRTWVFAAALVLLAACKPPEAIRYDGKTVTAHGWKGAAASDWSRVLRVYASTDPTAPPVGGTYERHGGRIVFRPSFPPSPAVTLRVVYRQPDGNVATAIFPGKGGVVITPSTRVMAVYPTADVWPANTLKLYIQFSAPMSRGQAWTHIHLLDDAGKAIEKPFVEIDQELWDPAGTRLTVLFDPGRIKRGLVDHDTAGPPLVPGRRYRLRIDRDWLDAAGAPLASAFDRSITAGPDVRLPVDPKAWKINQPTQDQALIVQFPRPMDYALARAIITVRQDNHDIPGQVSLDAQETRWMFVPAHRWTRGDYKLHVEGVVEDLAGNRLGRLFDVDTTDPAQTVPPPPAVDVPFSVK